MVIRIKGALFLGKKKVRSPKVAQKGGLEKKRVKRGRRNFTCSFSALFFWGVAYLKGYYLCALALWPPFFSAKTNSLRVFFIKFFRKS